MTLESAFLQVHDLARSRARVKRGSGSETISFVTSNRYLSKETIKKRFHNDYQILGEGGTSRVSVSFFNDYRFSVTL